MEDIKIKSVMKTLDGGSEVTETTFENGEVGFESSSEPGPNSVVPNPELEGDEPNLEGLQVGNSKFAVPQGDVTEEELQAAMAKGLRVITVPADKYAEPLDEILDTEELNDLFNGKACLRFYDDGTSDGNLITYYPQLASSGAVLLVRFSLDTINNMNDLWNIRLTDPGYSCQDIYDNEEAVNIPTQSGAKLYKHTVSGFTGTDSSAYPYSLILINDDNTPIGLNTKYYVISAALSAVLKYNGPGQPREKKIVSYSYVGPDGFWKGNTLTLYYYTGSTLNSDDVLIGDIVDNVTSL